MAVFGFDERTTHVGFTDESSWSEKGSNFRSIACISASVEDYCEIESRLYAARCRAGAKMAELKWNEDKKKTGRTGAEHQRDVVSLLQAGFDLAVEKKIRINVIIWDKRDRILLPRQYNIHKKRDEWHLQNMCRTLVTFVFKQWLSSESSSAPYWSVAVDRHGGVNYRKVQEHIRKYQTHKIGISTVEICEECGAPNLSLQLADVIAGLAAYSHNHWESYMWWCQQNKPRKFTPSKPAPQIRLRFPMLNLFYQQCMSKNLGVTILEEKHNFRGMGLWTRNPSYQIIQLTFGHTH